MNKKMNEKLSALIGATISLASLFAVAMPATAQTRLKDIATVQGVRSNQLVGYGLVFGLNGTGDSTGPAMTPQSITSMLQKYGIVLPPGTTLTLKNVAAVMVTADLPAFVKNGSTIDVVVASMGDAKSLQGGILARTPLLAADGNIYAVAQGSVSIGGFSAGGGAGGGVTQNHPTTGRVPDGAIVEQDVPTTYAGGGHSISVTLNQPDFTTAVRVAEAISSHLPDGAIAAHALDAATIQVDCNTGADPVLLIASLESLNIQTDEVAKVVVNERTGTVLVGANVTVSPCAVTQSDFTVEIKNTSTVSQPAPKSNGKTVVVPKADIKIDETKSMLRSIDQGVTLDQVVHSLNSLGVSPRDLISILQAMNDAGALHGELVVE